MVKILYFEMVLYLIHFFVYFPFNLWLFFELEILFLKCWLKNKSKEILDSLYVY